MFVAEDSVYSCTLSLHLQQGKEKWPWIHLQSDAYDANGMGDHLFRINPGTFHMCVYMCVSSHFSLARVLHPPYQLVIGPAAIFFNYASKIVCVLLLRAVVNLGRVQVKRSYCRYHKHRHSACCLLACVQLHIWLYHHQSRPSSLHA